MIKNRTVQLMFQTAYCALGALGVIACLGIFNISEGIKWDFYVHFTNLSNFYCIGISFVGLIQTIRKKENGYVSACPMLKFIGLLMILLTFFVFNIMLAPARESYLNFRINSVLFHIVLPIMYVVEWFLFYERKKVKWHYPLFSILAPLIYVVFVYVRAWICNFNTEVPYLYPYFFLNLEQLGVIGVLKWIGILLLAFVVVGYLLYALDILLRPRKKDKDN